jgi:sugar phosphate permease
MASREQVRAFSLTWLAYASIYLTRKNFSVAKAHIEDRLGVSRDLLGAIDTAYVTTYAAGQFVWGVVADRVGPRRVIAGGMLASAAISVAFGASSLAWLFVVLWALNGVAQSTGWCANLKAMTAWFPAERRGTVMGFWATCYMIGSLVANPIAVAFIGLGLGVGWRMGFYGPAIPVAIIGLLVLLRLPEKPIPVDVEARARFHAEVARERRRVLATPLTWAIGASYFFMKLIRYVLFFWLPYFMKRDLGYSDALAGIVPLAFEAGGFLGAIAAGLVSDRVFHGRRVVVGVISLLLLAAALPFYAWMLRLGVWPNVFALAVVGFLLYAPDSLLSGAAAQDLGGDAAAATAGGVINGLGSLGPILGSAFAAGLSRWLGWTGFFATLGAGALIGAVILVPFLRRPSPPPAASR